MTQLNIHMSPSFKRELQRFMKMRHIKTKAKAIRTAVKERLEHSVAHNKPTDFSNWIGMGLQVPVNKKPRFQSNDDLFNI